MAKVTYKTSGVDIRAAGAFKNKIKYLASSSFRPEVLKGIGGFGSFFSLSRLKYREPVLVSSSDGVGTKLKIASLVNKHDSVGVDAVAMNVNDILCVGAETLFFLDYIAYSRVEEKVLVDLVKGLNQGCLISGCALIGGETAQMPGMYAAGEYDLAGFCVGVVEKSRIIDGSRIRPGDQVIGIASSGIHSNGYSLVRKVFSLAEQKRLSRQLLTPTRIYVKPVLDLLRRFNRGKEQAIHGISHITGGSFYDKIARILPEKVKVRLDKSSWPKPETFRLIQEKGGIADSEIYHTLNMGIGMALIVEPKAVKKIISRLGELKLRSWVIGEALKGEKAVEIS